MRRWLRYIWWASLALVIASLFLFPMWGIFLSLLACAILGGICLKLEGVKDSKFLQAHDEIRDEFAKRQLEGKTPGQRF